MGQFRSAPAKYLVQVCVVLVYLAWEGRQEMAGPAAAAAPTPWAHSTPPHPFPTPELLGAALTCVSAHSNWIWRQQDCQLMYVLSLHVLWHVCDPGGAHALLVQEGIGWNYHTGIDIER